MMRQWLERLDPGLGQLRAAVAAMAAVLASYGFALGLTHLAGLHVGIVVLAVAITVTLERTQRRAGASSRGRAVAFAVLPVCAALASEIGRQMLRHGDAGDALFVAGVAAAIWVRRFGAGAARAGTLATVALVAILITPGDPAAGTSYSLWSAVVAAFALGSITVSGQIARRVGLLQSASAGAPTAAGGPGPPAPSPPSRPSSSSVQTSRRRKLETGTRMALQMAVGLAAAFALGRALYPAHWTWIVLTAYIVAGANRGRGDVVYKAAQRVAGAAAGTLLATLAAGAFAPGQASAVVAIFVVLGVAVWLRGIDYAFWAAGITAALALLYAYFGQSGSALLTQRLLEIVLGASVAILSSWLILPVRTLDVLRLRRHQAIVALTALLNAAPADPEVIGRHHRHAHLSIDRVEEIARPLIAHRWLRRPWRTGPHAADSIDTLIGCRPIIDTIAGVGHAPDADPETAAARVDAAARELDAQIDRLRRQARETAA